MKAGVKLYTEAQVRKFEREAVTVCKINDAAANIGYAGSRRDAAEDILRSANITRREIRKHVSDPYTRRKLYELIKD